MRRMTRVVSKEKAMKENVKVTLFSPGIGKRGMTELHYAAYSGDMEMLKEAIQSKFEINAKDDYRGYTPLLWLADMAATGGPRLEMFNLLIQNGADLNAKSNDNKTFFDLAKEAGNETGDLLYANARLLMKKIKGKNQHK